MKKFIIGLIIGAALFIPGAAIAQKVVELPYPNQIYNIDAHSGGIHVFDDQDNKCYVVITDGRTNTIGDENSSISCVKR